MHYSVIKPFSIENGPGVRVSLFVSGCRNKCHGCFQKETWAFDYGTEYTERTENEIVAMVSHERVDGITFLGGEPMEPENQPVLLSLAKRLKSELPNKTIWVYTGCVLENDLVKGKRNYVPGVTNEFFSFIDVLVDGPFVEDKKNLMLKFRGSSNQRVIDFQKWRETGKVTEYEV